MVQIFMISQIMTQLNNTTKLEKYQQDFLDFTYLEKNYRLIALDLSKQKALDADSRAIQEIIFTGKIKATVADTRIRIYYILEQ